MLNKINISPRKKSLIVYIFLTAAILAVFWQVNNYGFINFDDDVYVTQNSNVRSGISVAGIRWAFTTTYAEFWHPLTWLSLMLDYQFYGLQAGGYHVTSLILHIISALLLFWLFNRMTGSVWRSAFLAGIYAIHPLRVESVAWIAERKDVLSAFFWMLTLCLYVYYTEKPSLGKYLLVLFSFACALMSKSMVVTLPVVMLLLDYWPLNRLQSRISATGLTNAAPVDANQGKNKGKANKGSLRKKVSAHSERKLSAPEMAGIIPLWQLREKIPFFFFSAVFSILTIYAQRKPTIEEQPFSLAARLINAPVSFVIYLKKTFWPDDLAIVYPFQEQLPAWQALFAVLLIIVISAAVIVWVKRRPYFFVGWFWYAITVLPIIGIIPVGDPLADRYIYLPSIGIAVMLAWGVPSFIKNEEMRKKILFPAGIIVLSVLGVLTWRQCGYWKDSATLFNHALRVTQDNYLAYNARGVTYAKAGRHEPAIADFNEVIRIKPIYANAYYNRGNSYANSGNYQQAVADFNEAIRLQSDSGFTYYHRGLAYTQLGQHEQAVKDFSKAIKLQPAYAAAYYSRGTSYGELGRHELAIDDYNKAINLQPASEIAYYNRGVIYLKLGQYHRAIEDFNEAIRLKSDYADAYNGRGIAFLSQDKRELGCQDAQKACELGNCIGLKLAKRKGDCP